MLSLNATFENSLGRRHSFNLKDPDRNKPAEEIRASLQKLVELNLFEKGEVGLFKKLLSAKFVETIETPIFDLRNEDEPAVAVVEVQPEPVQAIEVQEQVAPTIEIQPESVQIQEAPASTTQAKATQLQEVTPVEAQPVPIQSVEKLIQTNEAAAAQGEMQQLEIIIPDGVDVSNLTEEDYRAIILSQLPEGAILDSFSVEEVPSDNQKSSENVATSVNRQTPSVQAGSNIANQLSSEALEMIGEIEKEPAEERSSGWFPKRKKGTNPLAGFSADKRKRKKAINRWKREKNKKK
ncbi:DUF2922 family protein [Enterococcus sp. 669A]|uniref:DUF2922 family protein n=1 Tax=Candidatus Enterococcus moelleringii TaxID=2815325 RepID=A0ABS3LFH3_9ENTE|nr:DUF2922 domain-containing protein [Enterococcus sp. 669A]MBO1308383.1 DUF2922 family protein [Enterococcus sp. 669A]